MRQYLFYKMKKIITPLENISPFFKKINYAIDNSITKRAHKNKYELLTREIQDKSFSFMNYGYMPLDKSEIMPEISKEDAQFKYHIQLYHHLISQISLENKEVLEVGSGRGGGCYYIYHYLHPKKIVGLDYSESNVSLSQKTFSSDSLVFKHGDAESLPFENCVFDVIINVESSHCYPNVNKFISEVCRVLRPNGYFLYTDFRSAADMIKLKEMLENSQMTILKYKDITQNVVQSINFDNERRAAVLKSMANTEKRYNALAEFSRLVGTKGYESFCNRSETYMSFVLQKS